MSHGLIKELLIAIVLFGGALALGTYLGDPFTLLCLATAVYFVWHLLNLWRLHQWLKLGGGPRPQVSGLARELAAEIDLLQRKRMKGKRKASGFLKRMREAISALPDAAVILDKRDRVEWSNPSARELLGVAWPKSGNTPITDLLQQQDFLDYLSAGSLDQPLEMTSPTGSGRHLSIQVTRFGKKNQRLLVARDVTVLHNLDSVRRDFVANVSHELRTPLTVLTGFLETMGDDAEHCPEWSRSVELMEEQTRRMQAVVNDLLALSKLEMDTEGEQDLIPVPALLQAIVEDARNVSFDGQHRVDLNADSELWLQGSPEELRSALSNLVVNAVQHTPPGTSVKVTWERDGDDALFSVEDDGEGIPAKHLPRLTERFYRVDKHRSRRRGGTGLGLAIVKHALARHGSHLEVSSREGEGTRFEARFGGDRLATGSATHTLNPARQ